MFEAISAAARRAILDELVERDGQMLFDLCSRLAMKHKLALTRQDKALEFYTTKLGFMKKTEIRLGEAKWLTAVSPDDPDGMELSLEPDSHPATGPFKKALGWPSRRSPSAIFRPNTNG